MADVPGWLVEGTGSAMHAGCNRCVGSTVHPRYVQDLHRNQCISEVFESAVPTHQFRVVDEGHDWTKSKNFPIGENDVAKGLIMFMIGSDEEHPIIQVFPYF